MNRPFFTSASNPSVTRQPLFQAPPPTKPVIQERFHSRNTSDPQDYHRRAAPNLPPLQDRYNDDDEDEDTEDADEDEDVEMTAYSTRSGLPNSSMGSNSRPGSSSKDSGSAPKKPKTKSTKVFQCTGYGDCTMQFTRSEHLARHIRLESW